MHQRCVGEVTIEAERNLAQQEVADRIDTVLVDQHVGFNDIRHALAHLLAFNGPPAVGEHFFRQRQTGGHEEGWPVNGMETEDIFTDDMDVGRPEIFKITLFVVRIAKGGDVVVEGIEPHIDHMLIVAGHRDPPRETGAGDRQVTQSFADKTQYFISA